ncbi:siderophore-interacting protein [Cereibacter azotoformans]|uniref:FAD-binding FR-type domain-containing protein n=1 Tax=Cereibacter sphaeroides (strain ATCC 17025 / ATH 2.4.3) TaxID=349102 RepID=A4WZH1_CERS5|nr:siderophore-interacting protein [Cereibacter azotoformans]ULB11440.1 siderophore-interacting protein [Cereibacter azotoformans]
MRVSLTACLPGCAAVALLARAEADDWPVRAVPGGFAVQVWGGEVRLSGLELRLEAADACQLFVLQEAMTLLFEAAGARPVWERVATGDLPPTLSLLRVEGVRDASPSFRRVRLTGNVSRFANGGLHVRLLLPPEGRPPEWPVIDASGRTRWPEGAAALHAPVYTIRALDPRQGWLEIDIFQHPGGRTARWSREVQPGAVVGVMGPGGGWIPEAGFCAFFGDETALPAIARILAALPPTTRGAAHLSVRPSDLAFLPRPPGLSLACVARPRLLESLERLDLPDADRLVWVAGDRGLADAARDRLRGRGLHKREMSVAAYWQDQAAESRA